MSRVVIVSGASAGIGRACADHLHERGWIVVGASRIAKGSSGWTPTHMDVDSAPSVATGVAEVLDRYGRIDAIVSCAGWGLAGPAELTSDDEAKAQVETLFWGSVRLARAVLPAMREAGNGRIVLHGIDRRRDRAAVSVLLQRLQVRARRIGRSPRPRGRAVRYRRDDRAARQRRNRLHVIA